jgi:hypothetical protein
MMYVIYSVIAVAIILGWIINKFDKKQSKVTFEAKEMPHMKPLPIPTKGIGFWKGIWMWVATSRKWEIIEDWEYTINSGTYVVPKGFVFDGASVPKFFRSWLSPMGVLLMGGLIHDYGYKYQTLLHASKNTTTGKSSQKGMDETFRDVNISVNGFFVLNYLAYYGLRLGGFLAWRKHRKANCDWKADI